MGARDKRPNFCPKCGAAQGSEAKAKVKARVVVEEPEEEEYEEELELPTSLRVSIEGLPSPIVLGNTINQTRVSEKMHRPARPLEKLVEKAKSSRPIEL